MRTPKISKRVLGITTAAALAMTGVIGFAGSSQAVVAAVKLSPVTGSSAGATIVTIAGKDFQTAAGASKVGAIYFSLTTCAVANKTTNAAAVISVISATKITITTPALALTASKPTAYNLCIDDAADSAVVGSATFTSYAPPTSTGAGSGISSITGPSFGGSTVTISGEAFTAKATATIGGKALVAPKVVVGSGSNNDDTITGTVPAGSGATLPIVVTTEGGPVTLTPTFTYLDSIKIDPAYGNGTSGDVISITGAGFASRIFGTAATNSQIALVAGGTALAVAGTVPTTNLCGTVQVESDTVLSCKLAGAVTDGPYTVQLFTRGSTATAIAALTSVSRSSTYTVSDF